MKKKLSDKEKIADLEKAIKKVFDALPAKEVKRVAMEVVLEIVKGGKK